MSKIGASRIGPVGLCLVWPLLLCQGCGPPAKPTTQPAPTTQRAPATVPALMPLPEKALLKLSDLKPAVRTPTSRPYTKELPPQGAKAVKEAQEMMAIRNLTGAIEKLERAVGYDPENPRVRKMLGMAYASLPNRGKALDNLRRAAKYQADDLEVQVLLGEFSFGQNQLSQAIVDFRTALACPSAKPTEPLAAFALWRLGQLLEKDGCWTASLECLTKLNEWIDQNGRSYTVNRELGDLVLHPQVLLSMRGELLYKLRRPKDAAEVLDRAFHRDRMHLKTARLLVDSLVAAKEYAKGEKIVLEMSGEPSQMGQAAELAETLCVASGDKAMPMRIWNAYRAKHPIDATLAVAMASAADKLGESDEALSLVKSVLEKMPSTRLAGRLLGGLYSRKYGSEEALRQLAGLFANDPAAAGAVNEGVAEVVAAGLKEDFERAFANKILTEKSDRKYALHYVAGRLAQARGKRLLAADQYRRAIDEKKDFYAAYEAMVDIYLTERRFDEVDRLLEQLNKLAEEGYFASYLAGKVKLSRGKPGEAVAALEQARKRNGSFVPGLLLLAEAYARTGQTDLAERVYLEAVELQRDDAEVHRRLFDFYVGTRRFQQAEAVVMNLLARQPRGIQGQLMLAELQVLTGRPEQARALVEALASQTRDNVDVELLKLRLDLGSGGGLLPRSVFDNAVQKLSDIIRKDPQKSAAKRMLAELLSQPGKYAEAAAVWGKLYEDTGRQSDVAKAYAAAMFLAGDYAPAGKLLEELLGEDPKDALLRRLVLDCLEKTKKYAQAMQHAEKWAAETDDGGRPSFYYRLRLLNLYKVAKEFDKAQKFLDTWIASRDLAVTGLRAEKIRVHVLAEQYDKAIEYADNWHKDSPGDPTPRRALLQALRKAKQYEKADVELDKWLAAGGSDDEVELYRSFKILLYGEAGKTDKAEKAALDWIRKSPFALAPRELLVSASIKGESLDRTMKLVEDWLKQFAATLPATAPASAPGDANKGVRFCRQAAVQLLVLQQKHDEALRRANGYLKDDPNDKEILNLKATALTELGRGDEALAALEQVHALDPNDPGSNNNLGYFYADRGVKLDKAEQMIRLALDYRSVTPFQDSLAWVLYKQGKFVEAGRIFEAVLQPIMQDLADDEEPDQVDHPVILDHAGDTYYRLGWKEKAVELWNKAVENAKKEKRLTMEVRSVLAGAAEKVKAVQSGKEAKVAPLGQGVAEPGSK